MLSKRIQIPNIGCILIYGNQCLKKLNGINFMIWGQSRQKLFAARDRFGSNPLQSKKATFYFSSEIKVIHAEFQEFQTRKYGPYFVYGSMEI
jgi:asparagine synthetase B (glutamine-hydrolysing)